MSKLKDTIKKRTDSVKALTSAAKTRAKLLYGAALLHIQSTYEKAVEIYTFLGEASSAEFPHSVKDSLPTRMKITLEAGVIAKEGDKKYTEAAPSTLEFFINHKELEATRQVTSVDELPENLNNIVYHGDTSVKEALEKFLRSHKALALAVKNSKRDYLRRKTSEEFATASLGWSNKPLSPAALKTALKENDELFVELMA